MIGVRIDVDTLRDAKMVPETLNLLEEYGIKASFFVTTGADETFQNFKHYLNPWRLITKRAIQRYGMDMFSGFLTKKEVERSKELQKILDEGHELGLHGYMHYDWMNRLDPKTEEEIASWISKGSELFEESFGFQPECFAAPGFKTSPSFLDAIDDFGFNYSSDFMGEGPFYPSINGSRVKTIQIPVSLSLGEEDCFETLERLRRQLESYYSVLYFHPSYEPKFRRSLLKEALRCVSGLAAPLGEQLV
jgi:undecaprenyl phosphate-alpha-L-ara4FN deformylase